MENGYYSLISGNGSGFTVKVTDNKIGPWDDGEGPVIGSILVEERDFCWTRSLEEEPLLAENGIIKNDGQEYHYRVIPGALSE